jgi:uncharacterized circularly permuted ATP-grasp superfamily protein/uncharacterized alpha-E superfamily protein
MAEATRSIVSSTAPSSRAAGESWHEMTDAAGEVRPHWRILAGMTDRWTLDERTALAATARRMIGDLGTTFNVFSDVGGAGQPYELDAIPMLLPFTEWQHVAAGLAQRVRLLDAVLADLYGPQTLLREGLVPPDLVHSNPAFLQPVCGIQPPGGRFLVTTGCDLARAPNGSWQVLRDHTGTPGGLGQVLENRNVISRLLDEPFESLQVARLGDFLNFQRSTIQDFALRRGEEANIVFLTPGFRHPSYFEHAYKARLLGFPLVEPADLTVREHRLFLKTLGGLRKIDAVICRTDHQKLDPLEQWGAGDEGIPGIIECWRSGNVALANAPGSGFAASPALMPFLPRICRKWFGEDLKLPFVETWWLGQPEIRQRVLAQLHRYVLLPAAPHAHPLLPAQCAGWSPSARRQWLATIEQRPHDFVVQADVSPSLAPSLEARALRRRPFVWRAFTVNATAGPTSLAGGLARVGKAALPPQLWPEHAGLTKDVWITDGREFLPRAEATMPRHSGGHQLMATEVPSRIAEQLFWVGRYADRIELVTRLLRVTLRSLSGETGRSQESQVSACLKLLAECGLTPEGVVIHPARTLRTLGQLIHDPHAPGGIPALIRSLLVNAAAARDRLSDDTWRFFNRLESVISLPVASPGSADLLRALDQLILHLAAFAGMQAENMTRGQGWRFLEVGRRIERAIQTLTLLRAAAQDDSPPLLEALLETSDSVMTYRRRHFSRPRIEGVIELIFFDRSNPRSLAYQIHVLNAEAAHFPGRADYGLLPHIREQVATLAARFTNPQPPDAAELDDLVAALESFSDALTEHFFSHSVRRVY